jgi:hypothetical protein
VASLVGCCLFLYLVGLELFSRSYWDMNAYSVLDKERGSRFGGGWIHLGNGWVRGYGCAQQHHG